jgi:hypothetical protein
MRYGTMALLNVGTHVVSSVGYPRARLAPQDLEAAMSEDESKRLGRGSAADLLGQWRAAERDRVAAEESAGVASLAKHAAEEASAAATETSDAARLALEASQRADLAAQRTATAAELASRTASRDSDTAEAAVGNARTAEDAARTAFHDAQEHGFPKG